METRSEILNRISLKKHDRHFNQLQGMKNRALVLQDALDETLEKVKLFDLADVGGNVVALRCPKCDSDDIGTLSYPSTFWKCHVCRKSWPKQ